MKILNKKIHIRVATGVATGAIAMTVLASVIFFFISYDQELIHSRTQIKQIVQTVEKNTAISLYLGNLELANEVLQGLQANDIISGSKLTTKKGLFSLSLPEKGVNATHKKMVFPILSPFNKKEKMGDLIIYPNHDYIENNAITLAKVQVSLLIFYSIIVTLLTLYIVNRILTKPMKNLVQRFHLIAPGDRARLKAPQGHQHNEIGALVGDINELLDAVNHKINNERELRAQTENLSKKFRLIFERASAGIGLLDNINQLIVANPALLRLIGQTFIVDSDSIKKNDFTDYFYNPQELKEFIADFWIKPGNQFCAIDIQLKHKVRAPDKWVHCLFSKVEDINNPDDSVLELVVYDITERAEREQNIIYEAEHDPMTLLLNRRASMIKLEKSILDAEKRRRNFAVLMIDLDGFKRVNDTYGHDAGDKVISAVANRIKQFFRGTDVVSRWGGDEFLIGFSYSPSDEGAVSDIAEDLQYQITQPIEIGHEQLANVGSSIGISLFPEHGLGISQLIEKADESMYFVKNNGKNFFHFYQYEKGKESIRKRAPLKESKNAIIRQ